jgi:hypothetical protein
MVSVLALLKEPKGKLKVPLQGRCIKRCLIDLKQIGSKNVWSFTSKVTVVAVGISWIVPNVECAVVLGIC